MKKTCFFILFFITHFLVASEGVNIRIITSPGGASIYFNHAFVGPSNANGVKIIESVPQCWHTVRIEKEGYNTINKKILVTLLNVSFDFKLKKIGEKKNRLELTCNVPHASVFLNLKEMGKTDAQGKFVISPIDKGKHSLRIAKAEYVPFAEPITIRDGLNTLSFNLAQKNNIPIGGIAGKEFVLNCNQPNASILIDGVLRKEKTQKGTTLLTLPLGNHEIRVEKSGWQPVSKIVSIYGDLAVTADFFFTQPMNRVPEGPNTPIILFIVLFLLMIGVVFLLFHILYSSKKLGIIGKFELRKKIGKGGIATIYEAKDKTRKKIVALKVMDDNAILDPDLVHKFFIEGEAISRINKEFPDAPVVKVFDYGRDKEKSLGIPYISMELIKGESLLKMIKKNEPMSVNRKLFIAREVTRALKASHSLKIYHGDITPDNIIIHRDRVVLIDFGVAFLAHDNYKNMDATITGKPVYMAPEHCAGKDIDEKSDIYSLGVILFFMVCGVPPFQSQNPLDIMRMHQEIPAPEIRVQVSEDIKNLIYRLLEKNPQKRPDSSELENILSDLMAVEK